MRKREEFDFSFEMEKVTITSGKLKRRREGSRW